MEDLVNEWIEAKLHPVTGIREFTSKESYCSNPYKKRGMYAQYDYQLPLNLIKDV
jgi:hypothetical protein